MEKTKEELLATMQKDMQRLEAYFPFRIVYGAIKGQGVVTGATATKAQANNLVRKGYEVYLAQG